MARSRSARGGLLGGRRASGVLVGVLAGALAGGLITSVLASSASAAPAPAGQASKAKASSATTGWPAYLNGPLHDSFSRAETSITPARVRRLVLKWHDMAGDDFLASPTVADGAVFIGSTSGWFYKLSVTTGKVLDKFFTGYQPTKTCGGLGTVATATVARNPQTHRETVYVGGADGYLYALSATNLRQEWKTVMELPSATVSNYFDWSSPTVANGRIYIGISSNCDTPLVRAGLLGYYQTTGKHFATFYTVPKHDVGGSIWSSAAVAPNGDVFATTGNGPETDQLLGHSESILKLTPKLRLLAAFQIPARQVDEDSDFGGSPTIFGQDVGACNKNGIFYALKQSTMKLAWEKKISAAAVSASICAAAPVYDGANLFLAGTAYTIKGVRHAGSVQERNPATGVLRWATGLPNGVIGSPTMDGGGVIAVGTYDTTATPNATYLLNASSGKILRTLVQGTAFAQSVFADNWVFVANSNGVFAYGLK
jgi:outer membrane protein assembly factor BamB